MSQNITLDGIQSRVASIVDQNEDTSDLSSAVYSLRRTYANMAEREWAETYDWQSLYRESHSIISTSTGNASVALPTDFRKLAAMPRITFDGATTESFPEIRPQERGMYDPVSARYVEILGDQSTGYIMYVNSSVLTSGASVMVPYYRSPASLVSPSNVAMCPNPEYLVQRTLAYVYESKRDSRFSSTKAEADKILQRMLEFEQVKGEAYNDRIQTTERKNFYGFRWGKS